MQIALVGPTHPQTGGITHHTTGLAHRLSAAGHEVDLIAWSAQYPSWLYPGTQRVPGGEPELEVYPRVSRPLAWWRPDSWWRTGRSLRHYDVVLLVHATTVLVPAYRVLVAGLRSGDHRPGLVMICHNVLPHERHAGDVELTASLLRRADALILHTEEQARTAALLTDAKQVVVDLPPHYPGASGGNGHRPVADLDLAPLRRRLLFFGTVRPYKGLEVLIQALAGVPDVGLVVVGDFWTPVEEIANLAAEQGVADRVELRPGYLPSAALPELFAEVDALVLPYRSGTVSQNVSLAHALGVPVVATRIGRLPDHVQDGVDGLLVEPDSVEDLTDALRRFYTPGMAARLRAGVRPEDAEGEWKAYVDAVETALAAARRGEAVTAC